ncbi:MAG: hypothetical protein HOO91_19360 [Bacteroidales bacterium]|nr:hypothetical protein [Bacteroidales bacterium]
MEMIIISEKVDIFSNRVEDWLKLNNEKIYRINSEQPIRLIDLRIQGGDCEISITRLNDNEEIKITKHKVWHRRGFFSFSIYGDSEDVCEEFQVFLNREARALSSGILMILKTKELIIGNHIENKGNKLYHLFMASTNGLNVPDTFVINSKVMLREIYQQHSNLITKPISDSFLGTINGENLVGFVNKFDNSSFDHLPETFFPTLFQNKIDRKFEIRSFLFCGEVFSMATFLVKDDNNTDIKEIENSMKRHIPYKLPSDVEDKMLNLACKLDIDTASFDFIVDKSGNIYFLEINYLAAELSRYYLEAIYSIEAELRGINLKRLNQYGQLNEMSYHCNYSIEEFVANKLTENGR